MTFKGTAARLVLACGIAMAARVPPSAEAQAGHPRVIEIDKTTCGEIFALPSPDVDKFLIYFDGFVNGMNNRTTWDERIEGEMINRVVAECKASPTASILGVFIRASRR
jgi:HdeA/HdeB family